MSTPPPNPPPRNRLASETSPYLLQHAANPVDWWAWCDDAFAAARERNVPVFLSVGYSTCYWCHVMERESFEDSATAVLLNRWFVPIKVDREERPDIDEAYMTATQLMTGRGGWPMSVFLDPHTRRPFWCGTYFPPEPRFGMPSFAQVLERISQAWSNQREEVERQSNTLAESVREFLDARAVPTPIGAANIERAIDALLRSFDHNHGGFGGAPKFPQPASLELLLEARGVVDPTAADMIDLVVLTTLDKMAIGGMHDQVGGGFHRYAVDATWTVPHFEKMLYDNAQLAGVYARAAAEYDDGYYAQVARRTLDYVLREMTAPEGGFHSAQDAEVNHREGLNYLWTLDQLRDVLNAQDAAFAAEVYGLTRGTNFKDPHHPDDPAANVLRLDHRPMDVAAQRGMTLEAFEARIASINAALYTARQRRPQPALDDKVLASWNGMMIAAMARAAAVLHEPKYLRAALRACEFTRSRMMVDGVLMRSWRGGVANVPGFLEDYAGVIEGFVATAKAQHAMNGGNDGTLIDAAEGLFREAVREFGDGHGGLYDTRENGHDLFVRPRSMHDGATPSGGAMMLHAMLDLSSAGRDCREQAGALLASLSAAIASTPHGVASATRALLRMVRDGAGIPADLRARDDDLPEAPQADSAKTPVEIYADAERITVTEDHPAELNLVMRIADGHHIIAAEPGSPGLMPMRVAIAGGGGVAVYADYPRGEPLEPDGALGHHGTVELRLALERTGPRTGRPIIIVTFQACTDTECLAPMTLELDVAIDGH